MIQHMHGLLGCVLRSIWRSAKRSTVCEPYVMGAVFLWAYSDLKNISRSGIGVHLISIVFDVGFGYFDALGVYAFGEIFAE